MRGRIKDVDTNTEPYFNLDRPLKQHRASVGRKVTSRPSTELLQKARTPAELLKLRTPSVKDGDPGAENSSAATSAAGHESTSLHRHGHRLTYHDLMKWLQKERARRAASKTRKRLEKQSKKHRHTVEPTAPSSNVAVALVDQESVEGESSRRPSNASSESSVALEMLREMLEQQMSMYERHSHRSLRSHHSSWSLKKLRRQSTTASSDTDFFNGEILVPSCDVILDNSKTLSYSGGTAVDNDSKPNLHRTISTRERDAWKMFKREILIAAHTLKLRGWRRIPLDHPETINVERLSGALTNAVYVVSPPRQLPDLVDDEIQPRKPKPRKLLLRIYGSQVDHLIDRERELQILRRLAEKSIGPRLLGTFTNGRFEEYLCAEALTAKEMRMPDISRQIAKRMRELHDGIELEKQEIQAGPFVWQNIDKWMSRAELIVQWLENAAAEGDETVQKLTIKDRFVVSSFAVFKEAVGRYIRWLQMLYSGGEEEIKNRLVFAHNDVSGHNIGSKLRLVLINCNSHSTEIFFEWFLTTAKVLCCQQQMSTNS
jgi:choline kinase